MKLSCKNLQLTHLYQSQQDYALSKDTDVAFWQASRIYHSEPELVEADNEFVIVNNVLHCQFDKFKKENVVANTSYLVSNSLLESYVHLHPHLCLHMLPMFGKTYLHLTCDLMDELCSWIYHLRDESNQPITSKYIIMYM